jgi:hypothetical protein
MAAITTFATLKTAVSDYYPDGPRTDITAALLADFFAFTQSKLYYGDESAGQDPLRIRQMISSATVTPATGGIITISSQLASGFLELTPGGLLPTYQYARSLNYEEPWEFRKSALLQSTVAPAGIYTIEGDYIYVAPQATGTIYAKWYQKFTTMSADSDTDWLLLNAPQVYLNGMLAEACAYFGGPEEAAYRLKFSGGVKSLNHNDMLARMSGAIKVARPRVVV